MEKLTRTERIARWFSNRWNSLVCLVKGHQDFGVGFGGADCLRCGRMSRWELGGLPLPRVKYAGDPERHRLRRQRSQERATIKLTRRGRERLIAIGWLRADQDPAELNLEIVDHEPVGLSPDAEVALLREMYSRRDSSS